MLCAGHFKTLARFDVRQITGPVLLARATTETPQDAMRNGIFDFGGRTEIQNQTDPSSRTFRAVFESSRDLRAALFAATAFSRIEAAITRKLRINAAFALMADSNFSRSFPTVVSLGPVDE